MTAHRTLTDAELRQRTDLLIAQAAAVHEQLELQNQRLADAIDLFRRDVVEALHDEHREGS